MRSSERCCGAAEQSVENHAVCRTNRGLGRYLHTRPLHHTWHARTHARCFSHDCVFMRNILRPFVCACLHICTGTALAAATSAPGTGRTPPTSAPGLGSPLPHLHRDWAHPAYICTGTGLTPATSAPGLGAPLRVRAELLALGAHATPLLCATELSRAGGVDMLVSSNLARVI